MTARAARSGGLKLAEPLNRLLNLLATQHGVVDCVWVVAFQPQYQGGQRGGPCPHGHQRLAPMKAEASAATNPRT